MAENAQKNEPRNLGRPCNGLIFCWNNLGCLIKNNLKKENVRVNWVMCEIIDKDVSSVSNK